MWVRTIICCYEAEKVTEGEAFSGGPLAIVEDGDEILIDAENNKLELLIDDSAIAQRLSNWKQPTPRYKKGVLAKYAKLVHSASEGAITG